MADQYSRGILSCTQIQHERIIFIHSASGAVSMIIKLSTTCNDPSLKFKVVSGLNLAAPTMQRWEAFMLEPSNGKPPPPPLVMNELAVCRREELFSRPKSVQNT